MPHSRSLTIKGCRQIFLDKKGAVNTKRLRNTALVSHFYSTSSGTSSTEHFVNLHKYKLSVDKLAYGVLGLNQFLKMQLHLLPPKMTFNSVVFKKDSKRIN